MKTITRYAKEHRKNPTPAEAEFKKMLLKWKIRFRSQRQFDFYIVDFLIPDRRLVIEVDGKYHDDTKEYDQRREAYLNKLGLTIIRITNEQVFKTNLDWLREEIHKHKEVDIRKLHPRLSYGRAKY